MLAQPSTNSGSTADGNGPGDLWTLFRQLTNGVYVIGVTDGRRDNAFTAVWVTQVSFDPLLLALSINPHHSSYTLLRAGNVFSVNVLHRDQIEIARHFGAPANANKLASVIWTRKLTGSPVLCDALAYFDCRCTHQCPAGDHELILGQVVDGGMLHPGAPALVYAETGNMDGSVRLYPRRFGPQ